MGLWTASGVIQALSLNRIPATLIADTVMTDGQETEAVALPPTRDGQGLTLAVEVLFGGIPSSVDYQLQVAFDNLDASFFDAGSAMTANGGGIVTTTDIVARFARVQAVDADAQEVTIRIMCQ